MFRAATILGVLLLAVAALLVVADSDRLAARMPTQVPPRRFARYPLIAGGVLIVIGVVGVVVS